MVAQARPFLEKLSRDLDEDVFLGMFTGHHVLILDQIESTKELKVTAKPGTRLSMFAGAAGKVFLAYLDRETQHRILKKQHLPQFTAQSITDPKEYMIQLDQVREAGVALDVEEYISNVQAVAVPVFYGKKNRKRMVAGVWLVGLDWHLTPGKMEKTKTLAVRTAEALSKAVSSDYGDQH
jgi:DNA-binding IclR family transcriptional regulator